jgi:hypothetical protein
VYLGMAFFRENLGKLENENEEHMPIGFEVAFPSLLERARGLNIDVPNDSPILKNIFAKRDEKLTRYLSCSHNYVWVMPISIFIIDFKSNLILQSGKSI